MKTDVHGFSDFYQFSLIKKGVYFLIVLLVSSSSHSSSFRVTIKVTVK